MADLFYWTFMQIVVLLMRSLASLFIGSVFWFAWNHSVSFLTRLLGGVPFLSFAPVTWLEAYAFTLLVFLFLPIRAGEKAPAPAEADQAKTSNDQPS